MFDLQRLRALWLICFFTIGARAFAEGVAPAEIVAKPSFGEPAISPDRAEIAFVSGGDIWTVPAAGGEARLLVSHPATESRPLYSPDGKRLAFVSTRSGNGDIYVLTLASGELMRLTFDDGHELLDGWSRDGKWIYFSTSGYDISSMNDVYRISSDGGTAMPVSADRYANEFFGAPSPDGLTLAFTARGIAVSQWWRKGHSHLDECEIWLRREGESPSYTRVTSGGAKEMWPMWSKDGSSIYYVSDRGGSQNIWVKALDGQARAVTKFEGGRVVWPSISYDGAAIVFERDFGVWMLDTATEKAKEIPIVLRGAASGPAIEHMTYTSGIKEYTLSPDGKKVAFVVHGEVFAASAKDGGEATRVTNTPAAEEDVTWSPDSKKLAYVSSRYGTPNIFTYDFANGKETQLTSGPDGDAQPVYSPDGKFLAYERGGRELRVYDLNASDKVKSERTVATSDFDRPPLSSRHSFAWSPDSRWIAYTAQTGKAFRNLHVVPAAGGESRQVSFLSNVFSNAVSWSPDGTFLLFQTGQRTESGQVARVDLIPRPVRFREDQFRDLFRDDPPRAARPSLSDAVGAALKGGDDSKKNVKKVEIVFENIRQRQNLLPVGVDVHSGIISPDGKSLVLVAGATGQQNLYTYALDDHLREGSAARQLTSTTGRKSDPQFSPDGKEVFYLEGGKLNAVPLESRVSRAVGLTAEMDVDFAREKIEVFNQAWTYLRDNFFDDKFNGVDWQAVREQYAPRVAGARTGDEMRRMIALMLGELNASHMGISAPFAASDATTGRLGLRFDRAEYESSGHLRVTEIVPLSPAAVAGVKVGEYLTAIDGEFISARKNLDELLGHKINRRVLLTLAGSADGTNKRDVAARPINANSEKQLLYKQWVEERRAYVAKISGGRLGYVHMSDMSEGSLTQLYVDLDAENHARDGVVMDVRNNNGGFVNAYAIDVLARRPYLNMTMRGRPASPARTILGQRALEAPTILVTNQHSLSDAEDFTEGYRSLKLGKVVGEPTAGWIVYTSSESLLDGSMLRIPFTKVTTMSGEPMELHPRPVDIEVQRPIGESYTGRDSQLDAAVKELLKQMGK